MRLDENGCQSPHNVWKDFAQSFGGTFCFGFASIEAIFKLEKWLPNRI